MSQSCVPRERGWLAPGLGHRAVTLHLGGRRRKAVKWSRSQVSRRRSGAGKCGVVPVLSYVLGHFCGFHLLSSSVFPTCFNHGAWACCPVFRSALSLPHLEVEKRRGCLKELLVIGFKAELVSGVSRVPQGWRSDVSYFCEE